MTTPIGVSSSDPWWLSNQCQIRQASANPGGWLGPYPSRNAAEIAAKAAGCPGGGNGGGGGGGGGNWWVVQDKAGGRGSGAYIVRQSAGQPVDAVAGPFATQAEAQAWVSAHEPHGLPPLPNPLAWLQDIGHWTGILVASLTDVHMWISLGWGWLGFLLLMLGAYLWIRFSHTYREVETAVVGAVSKAAR